MNKFIRKANAVRTGNIMVHIMLTIIITILPFVARAQFGGGEGTEASPYLIKTSGHLSTLANKVNAGDATCNAAFYKLENDIDLVSSVNWTPIGTTETNSFKGSFDGGGHKITGLNIMDYSIINAGLFGYVNNGVIKNLGVENAVVDRGSGAGYLNVGVLAGCVRNTKVTNCYAIGTVSAVSTNNSVLAGVLIGSITHYSIVSNCYATGTASAHSTVGASTSVAGILTGGIFYGSAVSNCYCLGTATAFYTGGGIGKGFAGGVTGVMEHYDATLSNCYSVATVISTQYAGGIAGYMSDASIISNCAALNPQLILLGNSSNIHFGRITGDKVTSSVLTNNIAFKDMLNKDGGTTWTPAGALDNINGESISKTEINEQASLYNRFKESDGWTTTVGKLPGLFGHAVEMPLHLAPNAGNPSDPYIIATHEQLAQLALLVNYGHSDFHKKHYRLANDIDLSAYPSWTPIGNNAPFEGSFSGEEHKITGLKINISVTGFTLSGYGDKGLFGFIKDATISNLGIENANINVSISANIADDFICTAGILAGYAKNTTLGNCYATGTVNCVGSNTSPNTSVYAGGLAGYINDGRVYYCYSTGTVNGKSNKDVYAGGLIGYIGEGEIGWCYSTGTVNGQSDKDAYAGGLIGYFSNSEISYCYSTATVNGQSDKDAYAGGLIGCVKAFNKIARVWNSYATGTVSSTLCAGGITGVVVQSGSNAGISNCAALNEKLVYTGTGTPHPSWFGRISGGNSNVFSNNVAFDKMKNWNNSTTWNPVGGNTVNGNDISKEAVNADGTIGGRFTAGGGWTAVVGYLPGLFENTVIMPTYLRSVPVITTTTLPDGALNTPYVATLSAAGSAPVTWSMAIGSKLPDGLSLAQTGKITGTPTTTGTFSFTVKAMNDIGNDTKELSITITTVGINETDGNTTALHVFPNPTQNELRIENGELRMENVEIFDMTGRMVMTVVGKSEIGQSEIDVSHLPAGVYFLRIGNRTTKFVKE